MAHHKPVTLPMPESLPVAPPDSSPLTTESSVHALPTALLAATPEAAAPAAPAPAAQGLQPEEHAAVDTDLIRTSLLEEVLRTRGVNPNGWLREILEPLTARPLNHFLQIMQEADRRTAAYGFFEAVRWLLPFFARAVEVIGVENVPKEGPVLLLANHPGNFDEVVIAANINRPDLRIFANSHPILTSFPAISRHAVFSKANDPGAGMAALRTGIRKLREGNTVLLFPTGRTDPDPRRTQGAEAAIESWSPSMELLVNKAPETLVIVSLVSGVVSRPIFENPLLRLQKQQLERQKIAGSIQMALQMIFPRRFNLVPRLTFSQPMSLRDLTQGGTRTVQRGIIEEAQALLQLHKGDTPIVPPMALTPVT
jgi:1-acyl-sn-glycerol-3-phosphate acyltransferase